MFHGTNTVRLQDRFDAQFEVREAAVWYRHDGLGPALEIDSDTQAVLQRRYHRRFAVAAMGFGAVILAPVLVRVLRGDTPVMRRGPLGPEATGWPASCAACSWPARVCGGSAGPDFGA